jgi:hypothetical protein
MKDDSGLEWWKVPEIDDEERLDLVVEGLVGREVVETIPVDSLRLLLLLLREEQYLCQSLESSSGNRR